MKIKELSKFSSGTYEIVGKVTKKTLKTKDNGTLHAVITLTDETGSVFLDLKPWQVNQVEKGDRIRLVEASVKQTEAKPHIATWEKNIEIIDYADPKRKEAAIQAEKERTLQDGKVVMTYDEESYLQGSSSGIKELYGEIKKRILSISDNIVLKPTKTYIGFKRKTNFVDVALYQSYIKMFINMKHGSLEDKKGLARDVSHTGHYGNGDYEIKISDAKDLDYIMSLIRKSFETN